MLNYHHQYGTEMDASRGYYSLTLTACEGALASKPATSADPENFIWAVT